jgi:hypothetical protein
MATRRPIEIEAGLRVAVFRYAGGDIHVLFMLFDRYVSACERGKIQQANIFASQLRKKLIANAVRTPETMLSYSQTVTLASD